MLICIEQPFDDYLQDFQVNLSEFSFFQLGHENSGNGKASSAHTHSLIASPNGMHADKTILPIPFTMNGI